MQSDFKAKARVNLDIEVGEDGGFYVTSRDVHGFLLYGRTLDKALKDLRVALGTLDYLNDGPGISRYLLTAEERKAWAQCRRETEKYRRRARKLMVEGDPELIVDLAVALEGGRKSGRDVELLRRAHQAIAVFEDAKTRKVRLTRSRSRGGKRSLSRGRQRD